MTRITLADFETRYRADPDPWGYTTSAYEHEKYAATLEACGAGPFADALELGGSIGVFSSVLAPRCERLTTIDAAPTAVALARSRLSHAGHVRVLHGPIPDSVPAGQFDLVVASEILYYLNAAELAATVLMLKSRVSPGARLVAVHWRPAGPERPLDAQQVHGLLRRQTWLKPVRSSGTRDYLLDVLERR
jgi:SAM-dependent methyltransferase